MYGKLMVSAYTGLQRIKYWNETYALAGMESSVHLCNFHGESQKPYDVRDYDSWNSWNSITFPFYWNFKFSNKMRILEFYLYRQLLENLILSRTWIFEILVKKQSRFGRPFWELLGRWDFGILENKVGKLVTWIRLV